MKYEKKHYPRYVSNSKRPFVVWYVFDEHTNEFVRKKLEAKDEDKAKALIDDITKFLQKGFVINSEKDKEKKQGNTTIKDAVNLFLSVKKNELKHKSFHSYNSQLTLFLDYCDKNNIKYLQKIDVHTLNSYFRAGMEAGNSARTRNNKRIFIRTFFNFMVGEGIITKNPTADTKKIKQDKTKNTAFNKKQIAYFWAIFKAECLELYFVTKWLFYSFIRPTELGKLKAKDIDLRTNKITVPQKIGKTGLGYIFITPPLLELIKEQEIEKMRPDEFIFKSKIPGEPVSEGKWSKTFLKYRLKNGLTDDYNLYCWKHTGVKEHFLAGNTLDFIQKQCRHSEIATTLHYLQVGLGLEINANYEYKQPII